MAECEDLSLFPGGDLVMRGLADLEKQVCTEEALLLLIAGPRLRGLGLTIPKLEGVVPPYEHSLYSAIEARCPDSAHAVYNGLIGRIVSFAESYGR